MEKINIKLNINGELKDFQTEPSMSLADLLKDNNYRGIRRACDGGDCGGCTVIIDGKTALSCLIHAIQAQGKEILTLQGVLSFNRELSLIPACFLESGSSQCGFCTSGFIMAVAGIYFQNKDPDDFLLKRGLSGNLCRCTGYEGIIRGAKLFFDIINKRKSLQPARLEHPFVGKPLPKVDGEILTTGIPQYVSDMKFPDQVYLAVTGAPVAHGNILSINIEKAEKIPGVIKIFTWENVPQIYFTSAAQGYPEPSPYDQLLLDKKIRFHGEPVAAVVANSMKTAREAADKIQVEYEEFPVILDARESIENTQCIIHEKKNCPNIENYEKNLVHSFDFHSGDWEWSDEFISVENTFKTSKQQHVHLEPHVAISNVDEKGILTIYSSTQVPFDIRRITSKVTGVPFSKLRVIKPRIGGGFGGKQEMIAEVLSAYACLVLKKPVKYLLSRKEEFTYARTRHPFEIKIRGGFENNGKMRCLEAEIFSDTGAYGGHGSTVAELATMRITQMYRNLDYRINTKIAYTNKTPGGAFRGYGEPQITFALESLMDQAAVQLGISPDFIRKINHIRNKDYLTVNTLFVKPFTRGDIIQESPFEALIESGKKKIHWESRRNSEENVKTGKGMAISFQGSGIPNITRASAFVTLNEDGTLQIQAGAVDIGTGSDTILTQIACDVLGITPDRIHLITADTLLTPYDSGAYASNTTYYSGNAVKQACEKCKNAISQWIQIKDGLSEDKIILKDNRIFTDKWEKSIGEIAEGMYSDINPVETSFYAVVKKSDHALPFIATFADIDVNLDTGKVRVEKIVHQLDCGTVINPVLAGGQVEGTTVQALGYALYEEMTYSESGQVKEKDLLTYKIPTIFEKPIIEYDFHESYEESGPFGAKALGELAFATVAPAIANAIFDAVQVRLTELPLHPWKVLEGIQSRGKKNEE